MPVVTGVQNFPISAQGVLQAPKRNFWGFGVGCLWDVRTAKTPQIWRWESFQELMNIQSMFLLHVTDVSFDRGRMVSEL